MPLWFRVWTYQQRICLNVSDSLQCWMWMWGWTGHDLYSGTLVWHIQTVPVLGSTSLSLLQCQTKTWCHLALVQMGHKSGQVSHQEWSHSWEPAALYLCKIENISKSTLSWLYFFVVSWLDDYIQFMQHGVHKDVIGVCTVHMHEECYSMQSLWRTTSCLSWALIGSEPIKKGIFLWGIQF